MRTGRRERQDSSKIIALHTPKALDTLIDKRLDYLARLPEQAYAARYGRLVAQVRTEEAELGRTTASIR